MKRVISLIVVLFTLVGIAEVSAQSRTSYFMEGSYFRTELNPALAPTRGYIAFPLISGIAINNSSNYASIENTRFYRDGEYLSGLHNSVTAEEFLAPLPNWCNQNLDMDITLFGLGFYTKRTFWNLGINFHLTAESSESKDMLRHIKAADGSPYRGGFSEGATGYFDAYIGAAFPVADWVTVGVKAKFLMGIVNVGYKATEVTAITRGDHVESTLRGNWWGSAGGIDNSNITPDGGYDGDVVVADAWYDLFKGIQSFGLAVDLGAEMRLVDDHLKLSAAITDLGFIKWKPSTHVVGDFESSYVPGGDGYFMSEQESYMRKPENAGYTTRLNCAVNIGAEYNILRNHISFGLLSHTKMCNNFVMSELTASVNLRPTNWITATLSHTFLNGNKAGIFGAALNIHPAGMNIFLGVDFIDMKYVRVSDYVKQTSCHQEYYIPHFVKGQRATSINAYAGFAFNFGRPKHLRAKPVRE